MSKPSVSNFPIDRTKFLYELDCRGLSLAKASQGMGRADGYLSKKVRDGFFNKSDSISLATLFGIREQDYRIKVVEPKVEEKSDVVEETTKQNIQCEVEVNIDYEKLYSTIYEAVKKAFSEVLG